MILAKNKTSSRLFSSFTDNIRYIDDFVSFEKFDKVIVPSNDSNIASFVKNISDTATIFVDFVTESGNFYQSSIQIRDEIKKIVPNSEVICISDAIGGNLKEFSEKNHLRIINSPFFSFYGYLSFTLDSFSLFSNNQFSRCIEYEFNHSRNYLLTSRNGRFNSHRVYTVYKLFKSNLQDDNLISALFYDHDIGTHNNLLNEIESIYLNKINEDFYMKEISPKIPIEIDNLINWSENDFELKGDMHHDTELVNSYIDLVTENVCYTPNNEFEIVTMTEKSIKPLLYYQIPLYVAQKNHAKYLKNLGFDLFEDVFPLNYDNESDTNRIDMIIDMINDKKNFDFNTFFKENKNRFISNRNLCIDYSFSKGLSSILKFTKKYEIL
jgi:hypothetical protein